MEYLIDLEPIGRRISCSAGETLLESAQRAGILFTAVCGGIGICMHCRVRIIVGQVSPPSPVELTALSPVDLSSGWRLACQTIVMGDVRVHVPPESLVTSQRIQTESQELKIVPDPVVKDYQLDVPVPTITDTRSDAARIRDTLGDPDLTFAAPVLRNISTDLRKVHYQPKIILRGRQVISLQPANSVSLGLAVDIGTTKLAGYLVDLQSGRILSRAGLINPQIVYGEDIMARLSFCSSHSDGIEQLRGILVEAVNDLVRQLCSHVHQEPEEIVDAVLVGNTAIHHLFLGLPVHQLGKAPYVAAENEAIDLTSREAGLSLAPGAWVHLLPNIAGFVGADHVAMLLASGLPGRGRVVLALDIGTNTEVSLVANGRHLACSTASGPAFEGAHIRFGMRAAPGAIEKVYLHEGQIWTKTVNEQHPVGICGSGIVDLVAQMRKAGLLTARGGFSQADNIWQPYFNPENDEFIVVPANQNNENAITFSLADVNEIQLAKGAIRAGINILLKIAGVKEADIDEVVVAGAFGSYLDVNSGIQIGMFPKIDPSRIMQVGNAAGAGACMALLSRSQRDLARQIARDVEYIELMTQKDFSTTYARALLFA